jgi:(p)ppGpp synthase/HD superfamily hydrolase
VDRLTVTEVDAIAARAHAGQLDRIGVPYIDHVRAVARGLAPFGPVLEQAGLLHDIIEDTDWTAGRLLGAGVSAEVVGIVEAVTNRSGVPYEEMIRRVAAFPAACLVKIADNAHNSLPERAARLPEEKRTRLAAKYAAARAVLWTAAPREDVGTILRAVNPALLAEFGE